ncbi:MAG: ABC transporter ATP-binding protein [Corynebacterium sp.]|nr:ABC transporter ATP-binding protein [Corynebacterium sp.]
MSLPSLSVKDLTAGYRSPIVVGANFTIAAGHITGIIGPNGAGKSTVLKTLVGQLPVLRGTIHVQGQLGYMPQRAELDWDFPATVFDMVIMGRAPSLRWWQWYSRADREATWDALRHVGLDDKADVEIAHLSGGQRQRAILARTLVSSPDIVLLDEPFAGIDAPSQSAIEEILRELASRNVAIGLVHHNLDDVARLCDSVVAVCDNQAKQSAVTSAEQLKWAFIGNAATESERKLADV